MTNFHALQQFIGISPALYNPRSEVADTIEQKLVPKVVHFLTEEAAEALRKKLRKRLRRLKEELRTF